MRKIDSMNCGCLLLICGWVIFLVGLAIRFLHYLESK